VAQTDTIDLGIYGISDEDSDPDDLLGWYLRTVARGPMTSYRYIHQSGKHQGQSYYAHVLDGIGVLHKLQEAGILNLTSAEEQLLFVAYTIHDLNKIELYNPRESRTRYADIATAENIRAECQRLHMSDFWPEWESYVEDIRYLMHSHQHDAKPLEYLNLANCRFQIDHERLERLGDLLQGIDHLDLAQDLDDTKARAEFLSRLEAATHRRMRWVTHRLGENRGLLSNMIHNQVVAYLRERYNQPGQSSGFADLLYYPEGVAYLVSDRAGFTWTATDTLAVARRLAENMDEKKMGGIAQFIKGGPSGIKVNSAAREGGASYDLILEVIYSKLVNKRFSEKWHAEYNRKLRSDITAAAKTGQPYSTAAHSLLAVGESLVPLEQVRLRRGDLISAYRNLLEDYLKGDLKQRHGRDPWTHLYGLLESPQENLALYGQIDPYRRGHFIAQDGDPTFDGLFERIKADLSDLVGREEADAADSGDISDYVTYLQNNLEVSGGQPAPDFKANLRQYVSSNHKQCGTCSSPQPAGEWMAANAPSNLAVQFFSNRLVGGTSREPKRNICAICRAQFILEKLAWPMHDDKHGSKYTTFYLHLYPFAFFTAPYLAVMKRQFTLIQTESRSDTGGEDSEPNDVIDNRSLLFDTAGYLESWHGQYDQMLGRQMDLRGATLQASAKKLNGVGLSEFSDALGNTPTLPLTAPGDNYRKQFLFALKHALMVADLFACRVVLSRTPTPLFSSEYLHNHKLAFFVDGNPVGLRWLLPGNGYRDLETYRDKPYGPAEYARHKGEWSNEVPDSDGYTALQNLVRRLWAVDRLAHLLSSKDSKGVENHEDLLLEFVTAAGDDPLAVYHVADRAIEERVATSNGERASKTKAPTRSTPESEATRLSKKVAGLLAQLAKESSAWKV
jgi:CRISPR-associated protein Csc3